MFVFEVCNIGEAKFSKYRQYHFRYFDIQKISRYFRSHEN